MSKETSTQSARGKPRKFRRTRADSAAINAKRILDEREWLLAEQELAESRPDTLGEEFVAYFFYLWRHMIDTTELAIVRYDESGSNRFIRHDHDSESQQKIRDRYYASLQGKLV